MKFSFFVFVRERGEQTCNFRQFVKTLAHFRPLDESTENPLNTREKKLHCKNFDVFCLVFFLFFFFIISTRIFS